MVMLLIHLHLYCKHVGHRRACPYLNVPVLIQIIDNGDASSVFIGIVHVPLVPGTVSRIFSYHCLYSSRSIKVNDVNKIRKS